MEYKPIIISTGIEAGPIMAFAFDKEFILLLPSVTLLRRRRYYTSFTIGWLFWSVTFDPNNILKPKPGTKEGE